MGARILVVDDSPTIRKVVAAILAQRGFEPLLAADGQQALDTLGTESVDLVLLDFVMPRMNGYQFCRELRADSAFRNLPVVLMSAKGDKIRGQFVQQTGAIDAITKPFDARGLVAVVEGALKKHSEGRGRPVPSANEMPLDEAGFDNNRPSRVLSDDPVQRRAEVAGEFAQAVGKLVIPELRKLEGSGVRAAGTDRLETAFGRALTPESVATLAGILQNTSWSDQQREVLAGDLSVISIAEILQLLDLQQQSGSLSATTHGQSVTIYLRGGHVDFASSEGLRDEFLLGRYLVDNGSIARIALDQTLQASGSEQRLLGELLVERGLVPETTVRGALERQTSELVYEVVRWKSGRFSFQIGIDHPIAEKTRLGLEPSSLVMEGFRRVDEWRLIEGSFDFDEVLYPDPIAIERLDSETNLTAKERAVLKAIDGEHTIRQIVNEMEGSSFELCKILFQFLNSRIVRRRAA
ncbi:MAG: response regulator [Myxococcota bacterium]|jgi:DNA-binding response OmpR family regulator|nr:response regulator [Myxococcota bacterium]